MIDAFGSLFGSVILGYQASAAATAQAQAQSQNAAYQNLRINNAYQGSYNSIAINLAMANAAPRTALTPAPKPNSGSVHEFMSDRGYRYEPYLPANWVEIEDRKAVDFAHFEASIGL